VGEGSGLGLAMVHGIVERHRGTIKIDSKPGEGSCFSVYFPLVETVPVDNGIAREGIRRGNERILLVDDEPGIVAMSCKMLAAMGYHVTAAANGSEAIERFQEEPHNFDLVITDMIMPDMTGNKLAQLILTIRPDVPVVLTTGYMDQSTLKEAEEMGICSVVLKPFGKKQMSDAIKKALDSPKED
jgi:CheY-like chemotaxis protein